MKLLPIAFLTPEWFAYRATRISGSTVAGILGIANPKWSSPLSEWARLTGKSLQPNKIEDWHEWGQDNEEPNRKRYQRMTGRVVDIVGCIAQHETVPWLCYSTDGLVTACDVASPIGLPAVWEGKSPSPWKSDAWDEAVPLEYQAQTQIGMEVLGLQWSSFSAYIWPKPRIYDLPRNQRFIDRCMETLTRFMDHNVAKDIPPEARAGERDREVLSQIATPGRAWDFTEEVALKFDRLKEVNDEIAERKDEKSAIENRLVQVTGERGWKEAKAQILAARKAISA